MDDGTFAILFPALAHTPTNDTRGPSKGGIRFHSGREREEVRRLSFWMTSSARGGPAFGGAKGGVRVEPQGVSIRTGQLERLCVLYPRFFMNSSGPDSDIPAPIQHKRTNHGLDGPTNLPPRKMTPSGTGHHQPANL